MIDVISVHVAKCGGTSFQRTLQDAYGSDSVYFDYDDRIADPRSPVNIDPDGFFAAAQVSGYPWTEGKRVVHGHFNIRKYDAYARPCRRITFLRHPVDQRISLYNFWKVLPPHGHTLQDYMLAKQLSLIQFVRLPHIRYLYSRVYFAGVERSVFDFVGDIERLDDDLPRLSNLLGKHLRVPRLNAGPPDSANDNPSIRRELATLLGDDVDFYLRWCRS